jgi:hypothetical protein
MFAEREPQSIPFQEMPVAHAYAPTLQDAYGIVRFVAVPEQQEHGATTEHRTGWSRGCRDGL